MKLNIDKLQKELYPEFKLTLDIFKQGGGLSRKEDYKSKSKPYPSVNKKDFAGGDRSYPIPTKADATDALRLAGLHGRSDVKAKVYKKYPELKKHQDGGLLYPKVNQLINRTNQKSINFVNRLKYPNRKFITNWENPNQIATHKMSWATDDKGAIIYPNVQNIKGKLIDFTRPPYNKWAGYNSAIQNNDTIQTTPEIAQEYTTNYKKFYPQFNK